MSKILILITLVLFVHSYDYIEGGSGWDGDTGTGVEAGGRQNYFNDHYYDIPKGLEVGSYYATWGIYGRDYGPAQMPVERLTHVYVAFGGICGDNPVAY